jgi:hypothetical protein
LEKWIRFGRIKPQQAEELAPDYRSSPRRSARLTPNKPHDGPASNLRKRSTDVVHPIEDLDDMSVEGLILLSTRSKAEDECNARSQVRDGKFNEVPTVTDWSPFFELREKMGSVPSHDRNIPHIEPIRFKDADGRFYAHKVFTKIMSNEQELPHASSEQHSFGRDEAVQKLTMECLKLQKLDIADGQNRLERTAKPVLTN